MDREDDGGHREINKILEGKLMKVVQKLGQTANPYVAEMQIYPAQSALYLNKIKNNWLMLKTKIPQK